MKIDSDDKSVADVLGSGYYRIPRFQRQYSWTKENVEDFLHDVVEEAAADYFIGSIVIYKDGASFGVVDGQQRLTTITMLLAALRDKFATLGLDALATGVHGLVERADIKNKKHFVLQPQSSYPYFQDHIQKFGKPATKPSIGPEERALASAFQQIVATVDRSVEGILGDTTSAEAKRAEKAKARLEDIRDRVLDLKLVWVHVDDQDDAYVIFETLNTRGKDLTVSDLVRNHLLANIRAQNVNVRLARDSYDEILNLFARSAADIDVNRFILHQWLSTRKYVSEKKLFRDIKKSIKSAHAQSYLDELSTDAELYRSISEPDSANWTKQEEQVKDSLEALALFGIRQPLPMVLSLMREYRAGGIKLKLLKTALRAIEDSYYAATAIASLPSSGGVSSMYARHARDIKAATTTQEKAIVVRELIAKLRSSRPSLGQFTEGFVLLRASEQFTQQRRLVQYTLKRIYQHDQPNAPIDFDKMTIEHLAPQSGSSLGADVIASIGNLILVDDKLNTALGSKSFNKKLPILKKQTSVFVEDRIVGARSWGTSAINRRAGELAEHGYNAVWSF